MPESGTTPMMTQMMIGSLGPDRPGIVAALTGVLAQLGANIIDSSMTQLESMFATILIVSVPDNITVTAVEEALNPLTKDFDLTFMVKALSSQTPQHKTAHLESKQPVMISVSGADQLGMTHRVATILAEHEVNITDLNAQQIAGEDGPVYILLIEAALPSTLKPERLRETFEPLAQSMGVEIRLKKLEPVAL